MEAGGLYNEEKRLRAAGPFNVGENTMSLKKQNPWLRGAAAAILALCCQVGFFFRDTLSTPLQSTLTFCAFFCLFFFSFRTQWFQGRLRWCSLLALFLGGMYALGKCLFAGAPLRGQWFFGVLALSALGFSALYYLVIKLLFHWVETSPHSFRRPVLAFFDRHPVSGVFWLMLLLWLPHLILKYPSGMNWDSLDSISSAFGIMDVSANQPVIYTFGLAAFVKLGLDLTDSANLGIFLSSLVNMLGLAFAVAYVYKYETEIAASDWSKLATLLFFCFSPFVVGYVGVCLKDVPFMVFLLLWMVLFARACFQSEQFWKGWKYPVFSLFVAVCLCAVRNNGQPIVLVSAAVLLILELRRCGRNGLGRKLAVLLCICLVPSLVVSAANRLSGATPLSPRESLSLPFQQTARLAAERPEQIRPEEAEIIDRLLDFNSLAEDYDPDISDPVKRKYNEAATSADLAAYLKVWFRQFFREPFCYLKATLAQNYYLFYPEYSNYDYNYSCVHYDFVCPDRSIHIGSPELISDRLGYYYQRLFQLAHQLPVLYLINNMTTYIFLFLALCCFAFHRRDRRLLGFLLPLLVLLLGIPFAPCIKNNERYVFPILYSIPLLFALYSSRVGRV